MRAVVMAGGAFQATPRLLGVLSESELLVAADAGADTLRRLGLVPHLAVGDFDSVSSETFQYLLAANCPVERHPTAKDASDTELALMAAIERGADDVAILGATGGPRLDHLLANVQLLATPKLAGRRARILDAGHEIFLLRGEALETIDGNVGDVVTLLPLAERARGLWTTGLQYALTNGTIERGSTLGLSNVMTAPKATVRVQCGELLLIHVLAPDGRPPEPALS